MRRLAMWFGLVAVLGLMLGTGQAQAQVQIQLTNGNSALSGLNPGPFATVTLTQSGSNVNVDVVADNITSTGLGTKTLASISDFGFNLTSGTVDRSTITTSTTVMGSGTFALAQNVKLDSFGWFAQDIGGGANNNRVVGIHFTVDNATLSSFRNNANGNQFAVRWYSNYDPGQTQWTGYAAIPEPGPIVGAGTVTLMGLGYTWRRRKRATT